MSPVSASTSACPWNSRRILPPPLPCHLRSAGITACATVPGSLWVLWQWNLGGKALTHWAILLGPKATYIVNIILKILKQNNECIDALSCFPKLSGHSKSTHRCQQSASPGRWPPRLKVLGLTVQTCNPWGHTGTQAESPRPPQPCYIVSYRPSCTTMWNPVSKYW